jgi:4-amino-4-deoxy-L-arabinose transferase-like glycosyltransferase
MRATDPTWSPFSGQLAQVHQLHQLARPARTRATTRWLWAVPIITGILAIVGWVLSHDTEPGILALSRRSWITLAAAAIVAILLGAHRRRGGGRLAVRVALEYGAVALVVALVTTAPTAATPAAHSPAKPKTHQSRAETIAGACPSISRPVAWASCVWTQASKATSHTQPPAKKGKHS